MRLWPEHRDDSVRVVLSPDGRWTALEHWINTGAKPRQGLAADSQESSVWLVRNQARAVPRRVARGDSPSFSPDSSRLAYAGLRKGIRPDALIEDALILDLETGKTTRLRERAGQLVWAPKAEEIALVPGGGGAERGVEIVHARTGRTLYQSQTAVNPTDVVLSPDGRSVAVHHRLARPLTGHVIFDRRTGEGLPQEFTPEKYAPGLLQCWSADGRWLLWTWRIMDPENDGSWTHAYVGVTSPDAKVRRRLGPGVEARFAPDGRHVLWLASRRDLAGHHGPFDLMRASIEPRTPATLLRNVSAFAVAEGKRLGQ